MSFYGIQASVIIVALITAYFGYQFNYRAKRREIFLKEILNSYNEVYFPMAELLNTIHETHHRDKKFKLIHDFFSKFEGPNSKIRFIGSSKILEQFYELRSTFKQHKAEPNRTNEQQLFKKLNDFKSTMEEESWAAHDIIYEDYLKFKSMSHKNPFIIIFSEVITLLHHALFFLTIVSLFIIYFSIVNHFDHLEPIPNWWKIRFSVYFFMACGVMFLSIKSISINIIKQNRWSNATLNTTFIKWLKRKMRKKKKSISS